LVTATLIRRKKRYGTDGLMIGRAAIGYPWIFREIKHYFATGEILAPPTIEERIEAVRQHLHKAIEWKGNRLGIVETRQHYTNYFKGLPNVKPFRAQLVTLDGLDDLLGVLSQMEIAYADMEAMMAA
jgi:tRNA-dihydrouridine synthase B